MLEIFTLFDFRKVVIYFHTSTIYENPYNYSKSLIEIPKIFLDLFPIGSSHVEKSDDFLKVEGNGDTAPFRSIAELKTQDFSIRYKAWIDFVA